MIVNIYLIYFALRTHGCRGFPAPLLLVIHYSYNHANQIKSNTLLSEIFSWSYVNRYLNFGRVMMTMIRIHQAQKYHPFADTGDR